MAILRYYERALRRRDDIELFTVGPYTGTWIPWKNGIHLDSRYAIAPDLPFSVNGAIPAVPISYVEKQLPWQPDVWIQVDAGFHFQGKPEHGKNVIIGTDPHVLPYDKQRQLADTFYCMQACYAKPGDEYLPYGFDPEYHRPEKQEQRYDVALIGLHYDNRNKLMSELERRGVRCLYTIGPVYEQARALYNQSLMGINWSSLNDLTARVFELLGMRRLAVVNHVPDLERFFRPGIDLIAFTSLGEAVEQIMYYRDNPEAARKIANIGHTVVQKHTWDNRVKVILENV